MRLWNHGFAGTGSTLHETVRGACRERSGSHPQSLQLRLSASLLVLAVLAAGIMDVELAVSSGIGLVAPPTNSLASLVAEGSGHWWIAWPT